MGDEKWIIDNVRDCVDEEGGNDEPHDADIGTNEGEALLLRRNEEERGVRPRKVKAKLRSGETSNHESRARQWILPVAISIMSLNRSCR